ncbi:ester cyclase [Candidatus Sulfurimonas baltica]|uniref:Ester cyclase n=1 Tax=Candidatus Sulfurimonas baltica TaxID=2740404 RepID=A0A7S7LUR4_9BACT|nr:ester cyclase [Candidatus Sulfurimonas baltica]QOY51243.1 ester cyclase [Candidatus Sulfurimonas baltica]
MTNKELISAYYQMWNDKDFDKANIICDKDIRFRGSLDITANGIDGFKEYAQMLIGVFPNLYHAVEMSVYENDMVAIYVTYTGSHEGALFDYAPTGRRICYSGASFFQIRDGKIMSINILGDLNSLHKQLSE